MQASSVSTDSYAKVIANSKRVRWDIEEDVLRGRRFDLSKPFLPSGLSLAGDLPFLERADRRLFSQIQGFHWKEESQHAVLDELEFLSADARLTPAQRDVAVGELIELVGAVDQILQAQAAADAAYFLGVATGHFTANQQETIAATFLKAYRWQYIVSGVMQPRFQKVLFATMSPDQAERVNDALAPLLSAVPAEPSPIVAPA